MESESFQQLIDLVMRLRGPGGCPHDRALTVDQWAKYIRGEVRELSDAIHNRDKDNMREEFGDVLWCMIHLGALAEESGIFSVHDALAEVTQKMIRRHPHVFGDAKALTPEEADAVYRLTKKMERRKR